MLEITNVILIGELKMDVEETSLGHMPSGNSWIFDDSVTKVFLDMLQRSIPQYEVMRQAIFDIGIHFVQPQTCIVDLGCSRGDSLAPFIERFGGQNFYLGIDNSLPMLEFATIRFKSEIEKKLVRLLNMDLSAQFPGVKSSLTLCILTLQFIAVENRQRILEDVYRNTLPGGAVILVEKVQGAGTNIDNMMIYLYHEFKKGNGYSEEEIERKRLALRNVLTPLASGNNEEMLRNAGFSEVDCFWRWMNFAGFFALKSGTPGDI